MAPWSTGHSGVTQCRHARLCWTPAHPTAPRSQEAFGAEDRWCHLRYVPPCSFCGWPQEEGYCLWEGWRGVHLSTCLFCGAHDKMRVGGSFSGQSMRVRSSLACRYSANIVLAPQLVP